MKPSPFNELCLIIKYSNCAFQVLPCSCLKAETTSPLLDFPVVSLLQTQCQPHGNRYQPLPLSKAKTTTKRIPNWPRNPDVGAMKRQSETVVLISEQVLSLTDPVEGMPSQDPAVRGDTYRRGIRLWHNTGTFKTILAQYYKPVKCLQTCGQQNPYLQAKSSWN